MRKEVLVIVLAFALLIAGCKGGSGNTGISSSSTPYIGGTEAVRIGFQEGAPPPETVDATGGTVSNFDASVRLENVGEYDIPANALKVTLTGIYPVDFNVGAGKPTVSLEKFLATTPGLKLEGVKKDPEGGKMPGGIDEVTFSQLGYVGSLQGNTEFPLQAEVCYPYQTRAFADFCMRNELVKTTSGVCAVKGPKQVYSSGSPIQVTSFDESVGGSQKVILSFKIKAAGPGAFYKPGAGGCNKGSFTDENVVKVSVSTGNAGLNQKLSCSGWGGVGVLSNDKVRLSNGEATVTCIQDGVNVDAIQKLTITIDYNNLLSTSTKLLVRHLPGDGAAPASTPPLGVNNEILTA